ncbi:MAG: hypothetical protein ACFFAN_00325 [Promethearchaeota archaeon]
MPLIIILTECGLELIPKKIRNHPSVKRNLRDKNYASQLLDNALHHSAMKNLKNYEKRGRPDIAHICLLNALGSSLNKSGNLKLFIHTYNNKIFNFNPIIRISRNFNRFKGLIAKLLIDRKIVVEDSTFINQLEINLKDLIRTFKEPQIIIFSNKGTLIRKYQDLFSKNSNKNYIAIIGGFQKSDFSLPILALSDNLISISKFTLDAWVVTNKIITYYEIIHSIL